MAQNCLTISGKRPDFYCDTLKSQFAVEAKGYSATTISDNAMKRHKSQSKTGSLKVNFSVASVAYNLYNLPKIKFYDPVVDNAAYDENMNAKLRQLYYEDVLYFVDRVAIPVSQSEFSDYAAYSYESPFVPELRILLHKAIVARSWATTKWLNSIEHRDAESKSVYIDVDGIGLQFA